MSFSNSGANLLQSVTTSIVDSPSVVTTTMFNYDSSTLRFGLTSTSFSASGTVALTIMPTLPSSGDSISVLSTIPYSLESANVADSLSSFSSDESSADAQPSPTLECTDPDCFSFFTLKTSTKPTMTSLRSSNSTLARIITLYANRHIAIVSIALASFVSLICSIAFHIAVRWLL